MTFYMTYAGRSYPSEIVPWVESNNVPIMTNVKDRWSTAKESFLDPFEYGTERVIDSAGYNSQGDYTDRWGNLTVDESVVSSELQSTAPFFPWSIKQYHNFLQQHREQFEWAATMDYACEERFDVLWPVEERIEHTIQNIIRQYEMGPKYKLVPVLQGRSVEDYMYCYNQLRKAPVDIPLDHVGLGTVCRISSEERLVELEDELREQLPSGTEIHGFGVKINAFKLGAGFDTADSHAWIAEPRRGRVAVLQRDADGNLSMDVKDMSDNPSLRTVQTFKTYYSYVSSLKERDTDAPVDEIIAEQNILID